MIGRQKAAQPLERKLPHEILMTKFQWRVQSQYLYISSSSPSSYFIAFFWVQNWTHHCNEQKSFMGEHTLALLWGTWLVDKKLHNCTRESSLTKYLRANFSDVFRASNIYISSSSPSLYRMSVKKGTFTHYHSLLKVPFFVDTLYLSHFS